MSKRSTRPGGPVQRHVYIVELKVPMDDTPDVLLFGSKRAIFEYFGDTALGMTYGTSRMTSFEPEPYENAVCRIRASVVLSNRCPEIVARQKSSPV